MKPAMRGALVGALFLSAGVVAPTMAAERPAFVAADRDNSAKMTSDVNARQPDGSTALQWAALRRRRR